MDVLIVGLPREEAASGDPMDEPALEPATEFFIPVGDNAACFRLLTTFPTGDSPPPGDARTPGDEISPPSGIC